MLGIMYVSVNRHLSKVCSHTCQLFLFNQNFLIFSKKKDAIFFVRSFFCDYLLTLNMPGELNLYGLYVYCVVHICDFGMLRVNSNGI